MMIRYFKHLKNLIRSICFIGFMLLFSHTIAGQSMDSKIDFDLIQKKKVRQFLIENHISNLNDCNKIQASWQGVSDISEYHLHEKIYTLRDNIESVWEYYLKANPIESWEGRKIDFGLLVSKYSDFILYKSEGSFSSIDTGQVYFLNLKLLVGLYNLPVAFEIIDVDQKKKVIEFSYIEGNISQGKQVLMFIPIDESTTQIIHRSYFLSGSKLRDGIYPYYHLKFINGFHRNMKRIIHSKYS